MCAMNKRAVECDMSSLAEVFEYVACRVDLSVLLDSGVLDMRGS